jgi:hypothetical protein
MGERGFEPLKAYASRFTVCPLCPLGYSPGEGRSLSGMEGVGKNQEGHLKAAGRTRTADLKITNHALCQLSYGGLQDAGYVDNVPLAIHSREFVGAHSWPTAHQWHSTTSNVTCWAAWSSEDVEECRWNEAPVAWCLSVFGGRMLARQWCVFRIGALGHYLSNNGVHPCIRMVVLIFSQPQVPESLAYLFGVGVVWWVWSWRWPHVDEKEK